MGFMSVLAFAQQLVKQKIQPGDTAIDATVGNGVDTLFLAREVGKGGKVYGFDVQDLAMERTRERLKKEGDLLSRVHLIQTSHAHMDAYIPLALHGKIAAVMFNLGYLPHAPSNIITLPETTLKALSASVRLIRVGGRITIVVYPGHPGGKEEAQAVQAWAENLPAGSFQVLSYRFLHPAGDAPYLIAVEKRESDSSFSKGTV